MKGKVIDRVTAEELRRIPEGKQRTFILPSVRAIYSGRTLAYSQARVLGCRFSTSADFAERSLTVTRLPEGADVREEDTNQ